MNELLTSERFRQSVISWNSCLLTSPLIQQCRLYSDKSKSSNTKDDPQSNDSESSTNGNTKSSDEEQQEPKKLTLSQRFKKTYKEHGKVLVAVHLLTSSVWFGSFYAAARLGVDIVPYLESWNFSEKMISPFRSGGLGDVALAYLLYKLATPARYTVTLGGTNLVIRYLRKGGKMKPIAKEDTLQAMYKEGKAGLERNRKVRVRRLKSRFNESRLGRFRQRQRNKKR